MGDMDMVIAIENVNLDNIVRHSSSDFIFMCSRKQIALKIGCSTIFQLYPFSSRHIEKKLVKMS